ncbi:lysozyme inhibitor LprI family protein [Rhizobium sp. L1K21]|uniref:lysozyme inhibitor LprI family protein n=1 Tax=Rhizobium sp. L1K21 TaxID=2954933 RepID=UPI002092A978|nr:hypothetical protein [Rhizobium sp. L1K21]MCO6185404.1 hypothetical protein [Rhizobium sp. L1K21]
MAIESDFCRAALFAAFFFCAGSVFADPSFDCAKANAPEEKAICGDDVLSELDVMVSKAYEGFEAYHQPKKDVARALLQDRAKCGADKACLASVLAYSLSTFGAQSSSWPQDYARALVGRKAGQFAAQEPSESDELPSVPAQCVMSHVTEVMTRFGEPLSYDNSESGTVFQFANGLYQVSYDREWPMNEVKAGHKVVLCLTQIPHDCPDGDNRGYFYYGLDTETHGSWIMPDSQHMCGGA